MQRIFKRYKPLLLCLALMPALASAESFKWLQQLSMQSYGDIERIYYYEDALYAVGRTGCNDDTCTGLLAKFTLAGEILWRRDFEVYPDTEAFDVTAEAHGVFVVGRSSGDSPERSRAFVAQYTHDGNPGWVYTNESDSSAAWNIAHDSNGLYVASDYSFDYEVQLLMHFDFEGNPIWTTRMTGYGTSGIAVVDNKINVLLGSHMSVYNADGAALYDFPLDNIKSMVYDDGFFYCTNYRTIFKIDLEGNTVWEQSFFRKVPQTRIVDLTLGKNGIWVAGYTNSAPEPDVGNGIRMTEYNLKGQIKNEWYLPDGDPSIPNSITFGDGNVFLAGIDFSGDTGFVAQTSELQLITTQVRSLLDADGDGYQDLVVLSNDLGSAKVMANVKSIGVASGAASGLNHQIQFTTAVRPVDFAIMPDANGNLAPELAVLSAYDSTVEIRDSRSGTLISQVPFDRNFLPHKLRVLAGDNMNDSPALAVLGTHQDAKQVAVEVRNSLTSQLIAKIPFNPTYVPKDFTLLEDINNDGVLDFALLSTSPDTQTSKLELRDAEGSLINNIWLGKTFNSSKIISLPPSIGSNTNAAVKIAILQDKRNDSGVRIAIVDPVSGNVLRTIGFNGQFESITAKAIEDVNDNGAAELALYGKNAVDGTNKVEIRDSLTGELVTNLWSWKSLIPLDIAVIPDVNGNLKPEVGILGGEVFDFDPEDFDFTVIVKDAKTGQQLDQVDIQLDAMN